MALVLVVCAAGATLAFEIGVDLVTALLMACAAAVVGAIVVKIGTDVRTARLVRAIADGDLEPDAAPDRIKARLASPHHRRTLARALRKLSTDAAKYPWQGRLAAPPIIPHFQPETRGQLIHLAEVLESPDALEPRGVALVEDLVSNPASPLFGWSDEEAEVEVRRALFMLDSY